MKKIVIGVPLVNKSMHPDFVKSLVGSVYASFDADVEFFVDFESGSTYIDINKNVIANRVLKSNVVNAVIFLSPNISWTPKSLSLLINHEKDIVSGVFPEPTTFKETYSVQLSEDQDIFGENLKADYVNMDVCYVSKEALKAISKHCPSSDGGEFTFFFMPQIKNGLYNPSSAVFCEAAKAAGIDINVEKTANFGNIGEIQFDGNYEKVTQQEWVDNQAEMQDVERGLI